MKPIPTHSAAALMLTFVAVACVPRVAPPPVQIRPVPAPAPPPAPAPVYDSWMDAPQTAGDWTYRLQGGAGTASFGEVAGQARFTMHCDRAARTVVLARAGQSSGAAHMVVRTESQTRSLAAVAAGTTPQQIEARLDANDRLLDAMALSKGRFAIEVPGTATLYLPSWAEVTRVIEDCR